VLPATKKNASTITMLSLSLALFFLCSWSVATGIVGAAFIDVQPNNLDPDLLQKPPSLSVPANNSDRESPADKPSPPNPTNPPMEPKVQPLFPLEPYTMEILRGQTETVKRVALTFDDGPDPNWTTLYLDVLEEYEVPATFFFIGVNIARYPHVAEEVQARGHEIGVHSHTHRELTRLSKEQIKQDLMNSAQTLYNITQETVAYFRPPYGATNDTLKDVAHGLGQTIITWNVDPKDWQINDPDLIANEVLRQTQPGSVILMHEGKAQTLQALPNIIHLLLQDGYEFVTVSDLFGYQPGDLIPVSSGHLPGTEGNNPDMEP
jgi:peptidoglycan/xylan/chitin deacetylase (PgdA/CDA1 family)